MNNRKNISQFGGFEKFAIVMLALFVAHIADKIIAAF